jgi:hypothetical protein
MGEVAEVWLEARSQVVRPGDARSAIAPAPDRPAGQAGGEHGAEGQRWQDFLYGG